MLHELTGDLLLSHADLLAHGVAPHDDFKSGLARALRERFPAMYKDFRHWCKAQSPQPGDLWLWRGVDQQGRSWRIAALLTQEPPKRPGLHPGRAHTEYVNRSLHRLKQVVASERVRSLALPRLATGVGGLDWNHILPLLRTQLADLPIPVYVYAHYTPGLAANEPNHQPEAAS